MNVHFVCAVKAEVSRLLVNLFRLTGNKYLLIDGDRGLIFSLFLSFRLC